MKRVLRGAGVVIFLIGLLLTVTYTRPDCSGIACPTAIPVFELGSHVIKNGGEVDAYVLAFDGNCSGKSIVVASPYGAVRFQREGGTYIANKAILFKEFHVPQCNGNLTVHEFNPYLSDAAPTGISYDGKYFVFRETYNIGMNSFYMKVEGPVGFNVTDMVNLFPAEGYHEVVLSYYNGTLHAGDVRYQREVGGITVYPGTRVSSMTVYADEPSYSAMVNCRREYNATIKACMESGSPEYQIFLGVSMMVLGLVLFWYGLKL